MGDLRGVIIAMPMFVKAALSVHLAMMQHVMCAKSPFATLAPIFTDVTTAVRDTVETALGVTMHTSVSIVHNQTSKRAEGCFV